MYFLDTDKNTWTKLDKFTKSNVKVYIIEDLKVGEHTIHKIIGSEENEQLLIGKILKFLIFQDDELTSNLELNGKISPITPTSQSDKIITSKYLFPSSRSRHTTGLLDNKLIMFGGGGSYEIFDDLWTLDVSSLEWNKPKTSGDKPLPRCKFLMMINILGGHSMSLVKDKAYIFGGGSQNKKMLNDLYQIDLTNYVWKKIEFSTNSPLPSPRASHTANLLFGNYLVLLFGGDNVRFFGELFIISLTKNITKRIKFKSPASRCAHTANFYNDTIYILGGGDNKAQGFGELHALDINLLLKKFGFDVQHQPQDIEIKHEETKIGPEVPLTIETESPSIESNQTGRQRSSSMNKSKRQSKDQHQGFTEKDAREITNFLVEMGLGRFSSIFINEEIDIQSLSLLTDQDLLKLGVTKYGPRKKILTAAEKLNKKLNNIPVPPPPPPKDGERTDSVNIKKNAKTETQLLESIVQLTKTIDSFKQVVKDLSLSLQVLTAQQNYIIEKKDNQDDEFTEKLPNSMKHQIHPEKGSKKTSKLDEIQGLSWFNEMEEYESKKNKNL